MQQLVSRFFNLLVQLLHLYLSSSVPTNASLLCGMQSIQLQTKRYCPIYFSSHAICPFYTRRNKKILYFALLHYMYCSSNSTSQKNTKNMLNIYASLSSHSWRSTYGYAVFLSCYRILLPFLLPLLCKLISSLQYISILKNLFTIFRFPLPFFIYMGRCCNAFNLNAFMVRYTHWLW